MAVHVRSMLKRCPACGHDMRWSSFVVWDRHPAPVESAVCANCRGKALRRGGPGEPWTTLSAFNAAMPPSKKERRLKKGKGGTAVTRSKREEVYARDGHKCVECGTSKNLTLDHIIPKAHGGTGNVNNLQTMCKRCNNAKGCTMPEMAPAASG